MLADGVDVGCLLKLLVLVDTLLDEYLLQRLEVQLLQQLALAYLSSWRMRSFVRSTEWRSTSLMVRNCGFWSLMTQQLGEMLISQSVKA